MTTKPPSLDAQALRDLVQTSLPQKCQCPLGPCAGWESMTEDRWPAPHMTAVGSLRAAHDGDTASGGEPTFEEFHPEGTRYESPLAPIAPEFFPYNRCDVRECLACKRKFLHYTEYGGYYLDERIRALDAKLIV